MLTPQQEIDFKNWLDNTYQPFPESLKEFVESMLSVIGSSDKNIDKFNANSKVKYSDGSHFGENINSEYFYGKYGKTTNFDNLQVEDKIAFIQAFISFNN